MGQDFPRGEATSCLFTPDREPITDQSLGTTEVQLGEPVSFISVTYRSMNEGVNRNLCPAWFCSCSVPTKHTEAYINHKLVDLSGQVYY